MFPLDPHAERLVVAAADLQRAHRHRARRLLGDSPVGNASPGRRASIFARDAGLVRALRHGRAQTAGRACPPVVEAE